MATAPVREQHIPLEELCRLPSFYLPTVSWAEDRVAYLADSTGRVELYVMDLASREARQVSDGEMPRTVRAPIAWDRTDRSIIFARDEGGNEQHDLYRIEVETGAVTRISDDPTTQEYPGECSPDNAWLTVAANKRRPEAPGEPAQLNLWKVRLDGADYQPLTRFASPVFGGGTWSHDGRWIAVNANEDTTDLKNIDGYLVHPEGGEVRRVFHVRTGSVDRLGDWHPDSSRIAVTSDASGHDRAGILEIETGAVRWLTPEGVQESSGRFSRDGRSLICLRNAEAQIRPIVYDLSTGQGRDLVLPGGIAFAATFINADRTVLLTYSGDTSRPALLAYDLATDTYETVIAPEYGSIDPAVFVESVHLSYPSGDGTPIPALLYTPRHGEGERLPALIHVHGGPTGQWFRGFDPFAQFLADRGLVVLEPNIRGSTGYGVSFRDAALCDWGGPDLEDIAAGAAYLRGLSYVDPERLVVFGGSYGGYMTFMAVTKKPDLWRAGVAWVGITDLKRLYDSSMEHFKYYLRVQMGDPAEHAALWADRSAINFAQNLQARLLIVHGVNDPRCPVEQARVFRNRLLALGRREGVDFEYVELGDEGHGSGDIEQKIRTFRLLADYLERVLRE